MPCSAADATLGKDFSLDTRQQKHHEEGTQLQRAEVLPPLPLASVPVAVGYPTQGFFHHFKFNLLEFSVPTSQDKTVKHLSEEICNISYNNTATNKRK